MSALTAPWRSGLLVFRADAGPLYVVEMAHGGGAIRVKSEPIEMPSSGLWRNFVAGPLTIDAELRSDVTKATRFTGVAEARDAVRYWAKRTLTP